MSYLTRHLQAGEIGRVIEIAKERLKGVPFNTVAVQGTSGLIVGAPLAVALNKDLVVVRKPRKTEKHHSLEWVEGWGINQRILIVDDFVATGTTLERIKKGIFDKCDSAEIVGVLFYDSILSGRHSYTFRDGSTVPVYNAITAS